MEATSMDPADATDAPIPDRIRIEWSGDDLLALDPSRGVVHRIAAFDVRMLRDGHTSAYEMHLPAEVLETVVLALHDRRWDRRRVLTTSSALAATGIVTLLLPSAALAASVGLPFNSFSESFAFTPTNLTGLTNTSVATDPMNSAFGLWEVPAGVNQVEVVAIGTSGGPAGIDSAGLPSPSPFTGVEGLGARVVATLSVTPGHRLVIAFSDAVRRGGDAGGYGGSAAAIGDLGSGSSGEWLLVAGGGGGAGQAGVTLNSYASGDYRGGDGGNAGTVGVADAGTAGSGADAGATIGQGGGGATTTTVGAAGTGSGGANGNAGSGPIGPTSLNGTTRVGRGGELFNNVASGGGGGSGLFGGGSGGATPFNGAAGGGGGGASFLRATRQVSGRQSSIVLVNRSVLQGPGISLFF